MASARIGPFATCAWIHAERSSLPMRLHHGSRSDMAKRSTSKATTKEAPSPTYFLSLTVENYRTFGPKQTLDLGNGKGRPAPFTVILGDNGTGKTSLLRQLVNMVPKSPPTHWKEDQISQAQAMLLPFFTSEEELMPIVRMGSGKAFFRAAYAYGTLLGEEKHPPENASLEYQLHESSHGGIVYPRDSASPIHQMVVFAYGANRPIGSGSLSEYHSDGTRSLVLENAPLIPAEEWLLQQDLLARHGNGDAKQAQQRLDTVIELLKNLLPDDDIQDITFKAIELSPTRQRIAVHVKTPYGEVPLRSLSLGYRTLMAWMIDLTVQMFARYPDSKKPLHQPAVVLVDEIDLHLHPKWQRKVFTELAKTFPNVQFIVTAHSPLIVQAASADTNLVVLKRPEGASHVEIIQKPNAIRNWRMDQILISDLFGLPSARSPDLDMLYIRKDKLLKKSTLTEAEEAELEDIDHKLLDESPVEKRYLDILRRAAAEVTTKRRRKS